MEKSIPSAIEHEGRLLVLEPHKVLIQSDEGQRYLGERHAAVMKHLDAYPALRKHLFTDKWAEAFQKRWLSDERTLASFCYPFFYFEPFQLETGIYPKDYYPPKTTASGRGPEEVQPFRCIGRARRFSLREGPVGQEGEPNARLAKPVPRPVGVQVSRGDRAEVSAQGILRKGAEPDRPGSAGFVSSARHRAVGRALHAGPYPLVSAHSAQVQRVAHDRVFEGQEYRSYPSRADGASSDDGAALWATGYCVSTVGLDEERIRQYIREQEQLESGQGDLDLK